MGDLETPKWVVNVREEIGRSPAWEVRLDIGIFCTQGGTKIFEGKKDPPSDSSRFVCVPESSWVA